jgi:uncharacterized integral membrane protein
MTDQDPVRQQTPATRPQKTAAERRYQARLTIAAVIGVLLIVFAFLNLDDVKVHWLFATGQTPLIFVILIAFLLGIGADRLLIRRQRRRRAAAPTAPTPPTAG